MAPLERTASSSSTTSATSLSGAFKLDHLAEASVSYVPYVGRRNTPAQLHALQQYFETTPHPTREERQALANDLGMELKSVTNWFQNRRQTARRKSLSWSENKPMKAHPSPHCYPRKASSKSSLKRSSISLDRIAALSERQSLTSQSTTLRTPLTPCKVNVKKENPPSPSELWKYMPSSPIAPQSSPGPEEARMAILPSRAKTFRSLEWACLKARRGKWVEDDGDELPTLSTFDHGGDTGDEGTETEVDEAITPDSSVNLSPYSRDASSRLRVKQEDDPFPLVLKAAPQSEDVEAAMTLLGFKAHP
ncbi:hypothetical protein HYDPIDRAFT_109268 [Hydnomerulius pinastri MD-312]|nr:hypothetical protein HYDPIDRAFT_109268 [Hydnomerulius pinastri MD-312]